MPRQIESLRECLEDRDAAAIERQAQAINGAVANVAGTEEFETGRPIHLPYSPAASAGPAP